MEDKQSSDKATLDSAKLWLEQRRQKAGQSGSLNPHTPPAQRSVSTFSSPGSILGKEEDAVIIELTQRYLHAGLEGESGPQCMIRFGPEGDRRLGDHRIWVPGYRRQRDDLETWGRKYELWRCDVGDVDLGLLSDVLERAVREAYNKHLLVDAGASRLILVLPSLVPHPVLESILSTLFQRWKYPSIMLLPTPTTAVIAAGLRSGLVVDVGWEETTVTCVYEYREVNAHQSARAMKMLTQNVAIMLQKSIKSASGGQALRFDLDLIEEIITRAANMVKLGAGDVETSEDDDQSKIEMEWPGLAASSSVKFSKDEFVSAFTKTFFGEPEDEYFDDHETPIPYLIYRSLQSLAPDVRGICMSRIVYIGQPSTPPSLRQEILSRLHVLIEQHGWNPVRGHNIKPQRAGLTQTAQTRTQRADAQHNVHVPAEKNYVDDKIQKQRSKLPQTSTQGDLREVHSLGSWAGASLVASLKVRGFVDIERDRFLSHGLAGAGRDGDISVVPQQRTGSLGLSTMAKPGDRSSWTLGVWG